MNREYVFPERAYEMGSKNLEYQHVMFPVWALYFEIIQESDNVFGSRMFSWLGPKVLMDLDLVAPTGTLRHHEFERDVSTTCEGDYQQLELNMTDNSTGSDNGLRLSG